MQKTVTNLTKAFAGESMARNRYHFYGKIAKKEGYEQIAGIFFETADQEIISYFESVKPDEFDERLTSILKIGISAIRTVGTTQRVDYIEKEFDFVENKSISNHAHFGTDLAIMTKCNSAILSPSSFGWWGAYLMREREIIFTPRYWLGFNSDIEYHASANLSFAKEVTIGTE